MASGKKISQLTESTTMSNADYFPFVIASVPAARRITVENIRSELGVRDNYHALPTSDYTATPEFEIPSAYTSIADWQNSTAYSLGNYVKPTSDNGFIYTCIGAGTSNGSEPSWSTTIGASTSDNTVTWECRGLSVITMTEDWTGSILKGHAVRYKYDSGTYYGIVADITATKMTVLGAPLNHTDDLTELAWGSNPALVEQHRIFIDGLFGASAGDKLASIGNQYFNWRTAPAYLVSFGGLANVQDTGAQEPKINIKNGANLVFREDADAGIELDSSWVSSGYGAVNTAYYELDWNDSIEVRCTLSGTNGNSEDLSLMLTFVHK